VGSVRYLAVDISRDADEGTGEGSEEMRSCSCCGESMKW
jgi:hypothetical protein